MTRYELKGLFEKYDAEFLEFGRVQTNHTHRPDLHAFGLLDKLVGGDGDIISGAEHDEIFLSVDPDELAERAKEADVLELIRCGVRLDNYHDCLAMFV